MRSSITSSNADCVLGDARLISSPSTTFAKTAPGWKTNSPVDVSYTWAPITSVGNRSGVNWIRRIVPSTADTIVLASIVFPVPGTSSISRCPSEIMHSSAVRTTPLLPRMKPSTCAVNRRY